jgi:hypothetical protein
MLVTFVGESPSRTCGSYFFVKGVPTEVPEILARSLLAQSVFEAAPAVKKESK